jgi:uncharacterized OsmC-like protein
MPSFDLPGYLAVKTEALEALHRRLSEPDAQPTPLTVTVRVAGGSGARPVRVREFTIVTDALPALAGNNLGPTAPELLLGALASCLAHSYLIAAIKHGVVYEALELEVRGAIDYRGTLEVDPAAPVPPFDISYEARAVTAASAEQLEAVRRDVERTCPVLRALLQPLPVTGRIVKQEAAGG